MDNPKLPFLAPQANMPGTTFFPLHIMKNGAALTPFNCGLFILEPGSISKPDQHELREVWIIAKGSGLLYYDTQEVRIAAGDFLFFESFKMHKVHNDTNRKLVIHAIYWPPVQ